MEPISQDDSIHSQDHLQGEPVTDYESKMVALRAERHDEIIVTTVENEFQPSPHIPEDFTVVQRTETYYGPKILLDSGVQNYLLTAPGPDSYLLLWSANQNSDSFRKSWEKLAEVQVNFGEDLPQYDLCPYCGEPMKTLEHERMAGFGTCPNSSESD